MCTFCIHSVLRPSKPLGLNKIEELLTAKGPRCQTLDLEFSSEKNSQPRNSNTSQSLFRKSQVEVSYERSEPAGLRGLRKQVTDAKEGPLEFRRKEAKVCALREERGKKDGGMRERERTRKRESAWGKMRGKGTACSRERESQALGPLSWGLLSAFQRSGP